MKRLMMKKNSCLFFHLSLDSGKDKEIFKFKVAARKRFTVNSRISVARTSMKICLRQG